MYTTQTELSAGEAASERNGENLSEYAVVINHLKPKKVHFAV